MKAKIDGVNRKGKFGDIGLKLVTGEWINSRPDTKQLCLLVNKGDEVEYELDEKGKISSISRVLGSVQGGLSQSYESASTVEKMPFGAMAEDTVKEYFQILDMVVSGAKDRESDIALNPELLKDVASTIFIQVQRWNNK